jgi:hypothetical protein
MRYSRASMIALVGFLVIRLIAEGLARVPGLGEDKPATPT